ASALLHTCVRCSTRRENWRVKCGTDRMKQSDGEAFRTDGGAALLQEARDRVDHQQRTHHDEVRILAGHGGCSTGTASGQAASGRPPLHDVRGPTQRLTWPCAMTC